jgi:glyoxylase-like metal-dependent hydrolase (beta-lactamase superfamily II)
MLKLSQFNGVTRIDSARTIAGRGYYWTTMYLVDGLLVDTGCAHTANELVRVLGPEKLVCIVNTHTHEDHIGANGILQRERKGLAIYAHPLALPVLERPRQEQPLQLYRRAFWGWPQASLGRAVQDGEIIETKKHSFQVIYTPGHSDDHICLYEYKLGWLFTGDLFVGGRDRALRQGGDIWQVINSLKQVAGLPLTRLFPGCAKVRDHPQEDLTAKIEYLQITGERVLELHRQGLSIGAISRSVFGGAMLIELVTLGHFARRHLVRSYLLNKE